MNGAFTKKRLYRENIESNIALTALQHSAINVVPYEKVESVICDLQFGITAEKQATEIRKKILMYAKCL